MKYKLLIFDLDNTVFDYNRAENFALDKTLKTYGLNPSDDLRESYRIINEQTWQRLERGEITSMQLRLMRFEEFGSVHGIKWNAAEVSRIYLDNLGLGGFLIEGADTLLFELERNFRLASVTNGISDVQRARLKNSPLDGMFKPLIISDEVGVAKPDPGIFEVLLEQAGVEDRTDVLMIGDSLSSDIAGAVAAGIDCCWYNPSGITAGNDVHPDYEISVLSDVKQIVLREE